MKCCIGERNKEIYLSTTEINCKTYDVNENLFGNDAEGDVKKFFKRFFGYPSASTRRHDELIGVTLVSNNFDTLEKPVSFTKDDNKSVMCCCSVDTTVKNTFYDALLFVAILITFAGFAYLNYVYK
ncbi:hypothetical protein AsGV145 [Agrotis segetum granulovirus]|uniref:Uncharacterized protein n=1 Tax=Agrotis segetum granulosis virus TaxID=10464 RepID=A0A023MHG8_GVAS|nr:hypothetical protein AsGV145 [Agrotis segetum granulovirus]AHN92181.1 hypothetical protein AsGV142 [Agrotis segetum granulovirus]AKN63419.1 hypothetical protein AsGV145 [Agrotis segetum granulovirus]